MDLYKLCRFILIVSPAFCLLFVFITRHLLCPRLFRFTPKFWPVCWLSIAIWFLFGTVSHLWLAFMPVTGFFNIFLDRDFIYTADVLAVVTTVVLCSVLWALLIKNPSTHRKLGFQRAFVLVSCQVIFWGVLSFGVLTVR
jgi:hypothetical protein